MKRDRDTTNTDERKCRQSYEMVVRWVFFLGFEGLSSIFLSAARPARDKAVSHANTQLFAVKVLQSMAAQLSLGERVVDDLERRLLAACGTTKAKFQSAVNDAPRYDFDQYTSPYISTPEEKQMTTNILRIVTKTTDNAKLAPLTTGRAELHPSMTHSIVMFDLST